MIEIPSAFWSGLAGAITGLGGAWILIRELRDQVKSQGSEIKTLRDEKLAGIETRVGKIEDGCKAETHAAQINDMKPALARIEGKVDSTGKEISEINGKLESWEGWIGDVRKESRDTRDRLLDHIEKHGERRHA